MRTRMAWQPMTEAVAILLTRFRSLRSPTVAFPKLRFGKLIIRLNCPEELGGAVRQQVVVTGL